MAADDRRRTLLPYLAAAVVLLLLALRAFGGAGEPSGPAVAVDGAGSKPVERPRSGSRIWVHVAGAVRRPGLYRVASDARAGAAVDAAGGLSRKADLRAINLAATVRDGQQVVVPARGEASPAGAQPDAQSAGGAAPPSGSTSAKLSLATATVEQLDTLDGIGPTLAKRIIEWRDAHGGFGSVEQLREVEGIGDKRFESLRSAVQP
jgi:competence protein ComEA